MRHDLDGERRRTFIAIGVGLVACSAVFLWLEHVTHQEFLLHLAAIPLEILLGALLVERWLASREKQARRRQLMYLKSYLFRSEMRNVFISNFAGLAEPKISLAWIRRASPEQLREARDGITKLRHQSPAVVEEILGEYVRARSVFLTFLEWAATNDFESIFQDMIFILHFIQDVELFKREYPDRNFAAEAARFPRMQEKIDKILRDGVVKFLDYAIELREREPEVLEELLEDYLHSAGARLGPAC